eukprot:comp8988_c0_seq1/m.4190 comp8988_c0_seq1/g.4190  ORF comp8988_c0_seq1/g.4190 comp8988_c0_seq1/m.4190 type:complete len:423 (-) comp8988_c0_seq1:494-1762(-)
MATTALRLRGLLSTRIYDRTTCLLSAPTKHMFAQCTGAVVARWRQLSTSTAEGAALAPPFSVLFFGTDLFSVETLKALHQSMSSEEDTPVRHLEVVGSYDKPVGKAKVIVPSPVKLYARQHNIPLHELPPIGMKNWEVPQCSIPASPHSPPKGFDVAVVVSFGHLIPTHVIGSFHATMNLHPSLLPRHRGASPIPYTILKDDKQTGVCIIELAVNEFDTGRIIHRETADVPPDPQYEQLRDILAAKGAAAVLHALRHLKNAMETAQPQPTEGATRAPRLTKDTALVFWDKMSARSVDCLYRAIAWKEKLRTTWLGKEILLIDMQKPTAETVARANEIAGNLLPGSPFYDAPTKLLCVKCADGGWVAFSRAQLATKSPASAQQFANGYGLTATGIRSDGATFITPTPAKKQTKQAGNTTAKAP